MYSVKNEKRSSEGVYQELLLRERLGSKHIIGGMRKTSCETNSARIKWQAEDFVGKSHYFVSADFRIQGKPWITSYQSKECEIWENPHRSKYPINLETAWWQQLRVASAPFLYFSIKQVIKKVQSQEFLHLKCNS